MRITGDEAADNAALRMYENESNKIKMLRKIIELADSDDKYSFVNELALDIYFLPRSRKRIKERGAIYIAFLYLILLEVCRTEDYEDAAVIKEISNLMQQSYLVALEKYHPNLYTDEDLDFMENIENKALENINKNLGISKK